MIKNLENKIKKYFGIIGIVLLTLATAISTTYFNYKKTIDHERYSSFIDNIYFKKTLNNIVSNLEPKYNKIKHKIKSGETFDKILENYSINKSEINKIKKSLEKKVNLNKLNTKQVIQFSLDKQIIKLLSLLIRYLIQKKYI